MTKAFSVASWNVRHFKGNEARVERVMRFLKEQNPDIIALYEATGREVFSTIRHHFPGYTFHMTEGQRIQEILLGIRNSQDAFVSQKLQFDTGLTVLRPGLLVTVMDRGSVYPMLIYHLNTRQEPQGMGLRDYMLERAFKFRKALEKLAWEVGDPKANYIFLGNLNIMGMKYPFSKGIEPSMEIQKWDEEATKNYNMRRLTKTHNVTFVSPDGSFEGDLDHVYAADHLSFKKFDGAEIDVRGWVAEPKEKQKGWRDRFSDHALLYFEVEKV
ncbi:MAG: endonuclease/exonuclease/phosphatase family protein [Promethearchaeota archaeon]